VLEMTAKDVRVASRGAQVPEITTRGGSPRVCRCHRLRRDAGGASSRRAQR
jgi:hypothetical protein